MSGNFSKCFFLSFLLSQGYSLVLSLNMGFGLLLSSSQNFLFLSFIDCVNLLFCLWLVLVLKGTGNLAGTVSSRCWRHQSGSSWLQDDDVLTNRNFFSNSGNLLAAGDRISISSDPVAVMADNWKPQGIIMHKHLQYKSPFHQIPQSALLHVKRKSEESRNIIEVKKTIVRNNERHQLADEINKTYNIKTISNEEKTIDENCTSSQTSIIQIATDLIPRPKRTAKKKWMRQEIVRITKKIYRHTRYTNVQ
ncbi:hypothetical protein HUJ04_000685 [Dendroctonus ponderosae]|nr:hypothetical protein HUJ04_000685 [Dendroctonus ponderosae]